MKRDVVFWFPSVDPYYTDRFNALQESGLLNFEVWYTESREVGRSWDLSRSQMHFPFRILPRLRIGRHRTGIPFRAWLDASPKIIITHHHPSVGLSILQHAIPGGKLAYYVETTFDTWYSRSTLKEFAKRILLSGADGFLAPGTDAEQFIHRYSIRRQYIGRLDHVIRRSRFSTSVALRSQASTKAIRAEMGLHGIVFLNVGRMWHQKGIDTLLDAYKIVASQNLDVSLLLVGDGVDKDRYIARVSNENIPSVVFEGFQQQDVLPTFYALGDVFVFPTRGDPYGLVVDEALAAGLPVISTRNAGEIDARVIEGLTGFLLDIDNPEELAQLMIRLADDRCLLDELREATVMQNRERSFEGWVQQVYDFVRTLLRS